MSKSKLKNAASSIGNGLLTTLTVLNNSPVNTRIREIDEEIKTLEEEKARLKTQLIS